MKMRREHLILISPRAVAILRRLKELAGDRRYLFPAPRRHTLTDIHFGYHGDATVDGFRRTASIICTKKAIDRAGSGTQGRRRGVYNGAAYLDGRREMLKPIWTAVGIC